MFIYFHLLFVFLIIVLFYESSFSSVSGTPPDLTLTIQWPEVTPQTAGQWELRLANELGNSRVDFSIHVPDGISVSLSLCLCLPLPLSLSLSLSCFSLLYSVSCVKRVFRGGVFRCFQCSVSVRQTTTKVCFRRCVSLALWLQDLEGRGLHGSYRRSLSHTSSMFHSHTRRTLLSVRSRI